MWLTVERAYGQATGVSGGSARQAQRGSSRPGAVAARASRSLVAIAIWVSRLCWLGRPVPPYACQVPRLNCRPP